MQMTSRLASDIARSVLSQGAPENRDANFSDDNLHTRGRFVDTNKFADKNGNSDSTGGRQRSLLRNMQQQTLIET